MVQETTREIQHRGLRNADMCQMDAEQLAFPDASFDAVLCSFAIFLFANMAQTLAECFRVLRPGGRLGLARSGRPDPRWAWYDQLLTQQEVLLSLGTDAARQPPELEAMLRQAGFGQVCVLSDEVEGVFAERACAMHLRQPALLSAPPPFGACQQPLRVDTCTARECTESTRGAGRKSVRRNRCAMVASNHGISSTATSVARGRPTKRSAASRWTIR